MSTIVSPHPDDEQLQAFGLGLLTGEQACLVESHVADCADCTAALQEVKGDTFVNLLRQESSERVTAPATAEASTLATSGGVGGRRIRAGGGRTFSGLG